MFQVSGRDLFSLIYKPALFLRADESNVITFINSSIPELTQTRSYSSKSFHCFSLRFTVLLSTVEKIFFEAVSKRCSFTPYNEAEPCNILPILPEIHNSPSLHVIEKLGRQKGEKSLLKENALTTFIVRA